MTSFVHSHVSLSPFFFIIIFKWIKDMKFLKPNWVFQTKMSVWGHHRWEMMTTNTFILSFHRLFCHQGSLIFQPFLQKHHHQDSKQQKTSFYQHKATTWFHDRQTMKRLSCKVKCKPWWVWRCHWIRWRAMKHKWEHQNILWHRRSMRVVNSPRQTSSTFLWRRQTHL